MKPHPQTLHLNGVQHAPSLVRILALLPFLCAWLVGEALCFANLQRATLPKSGVSRKILLQLASLAHHFMGIYLLL